MADYSKITNQKGFSLVEAVLAVAIGSIIIGAAFMAYMEGQHSSTGIEQKISAQQDVRAALDTMAAEIAMASYDPIHAKDGKLDPTIWRDPNINNCAGISPLPDYKGIQIASSTSMMVQMDIGHSGAIRDDDNEIITYAYDAANQQITRNTNCGVNQPFLGDVNAPSATARNVLVINNTVNLPLFQYFDGNGAEILAAQLPARIPDIRKIHITIAVQAAAPDMKGETRRLVYSTNVVPRNFIFNSSKTP